MKTPLFIVLLAFLLLISGCAQNIQNNSPTNNNDNLSNKECPSENCTEVVKSILQQESQLVLRDALQEKNEYVSNTLFSAVEAHLTRDLDNDGIPDNQMLISSNSNGDWEKIKKSFEDDSFSPSSFSFLMAILLASSTPSSESSGFFTKSMIFQESVQEPIQIKSVIEKAIKPGYIEPAKCNGEFNECEGGFFINLDFSESSITDEDYNKLPKLEVVLDKGFAATALQINPKDITASQSLFRRERQQIAIPSGIFKAIAGAREIAFSVNGLFSDNFVDQIKNSIETGSENESCDSVRERHSEKIQKLIDEKGKTIINSRNLAESNFKIDSGANESFKKINITLTTENIGNKCSSKVASYVATLVYAAFVESGRNTLYAFAITDTFKQ